MSLVKLIVFSEVSGKVFIMLGLVGELIMKAPVYVTFVLVGALLISIGAELRGILK